MTQYSCHGTRPRFGLQGSRLDNCYFHQDLQQRALHTVFTTVLRRSPRTFLLIRVVEKYPEGSVWTRLVISAIHFQGSPIRLVSFYTTP